MQYSLFYMIYIYIWDEINHGSNSFDALPMWPSRNRCSESARHRLPGAPRAFVAGPGEKCRFDG